MIAVEFEPPIIARITWHRPSTPIAMTRHYSRSSIIRREPSRALRLEIIPAPGEPTQRKRKLDTVLQAAAFPLLRRS
jgi:hypothetical protein